MNNQPESLLSTIRLVKILVKKTKVVKVTKTGAIKEKITTERMPNNNNNNNSSSSDSSSSRSRSRSGQKAKRQLLLVKILSFRRIDLGERGGVQPFGYNKRRSICRSTVVSESDPRANGTRCFGLLTSADTGKAASILRSHGANALALANALTEGRSIQTN
ncbi:hypothetical protein T03_1206 [Trichinella britovi]|uniref:Uncharacterized protein n=1 Tax=Trichinella britovi TaxID=45882 RepID=A0A0V1CMC5_TRIBR|nr:hypothetical protein T03_1206 [Trichinella britovi]